MHGELHEDSKNIVVMCTSTPPSVLHVEIMQIWNTIMMAKFEKVDIHKEVFARWLDEVVEKTIKERLSAVVCACFLYD